MRTLAGSGTVPNRDYKTMLALPSKAPRVQGLSPIVATKNASISCDMLPRSNHWADKSNGFESLPSIEILGRLTGTNLPHLPAYHHAWAPLIRDSPRSEATHAIR